MSRRSQDQVRAQFRELVAEWQRNPFGDAETVSDSEMPGGVERIDERLGEIAAEWPDTTNIKSLVEFREAGVTALSLLLERYHREQNLYIAAAESMIHAIRTAHENDRDTSPFLEKPGTLRDLDQYVPDETHKWIRARASVCAVLLVVTQNNSIKTACERVADVLNDADYRPPRGGRQVGVHAVEGWVEKVVSGTIPEAQDARQAFTSFRQVLEDNPEPAPDVADAPSFGENCLHRFAQSLDVLIIRNNSKKPRKRRASKSRTTK